jgi:exopolysaccharide biosynthesis polyprenyl glycosylphosphotransferase
LIDLQRSPAICLENVESALGRARPGARQFRRHVDAVPRPYSWGTLFLVGCDLVMAIVGLWIAHSMVVLEPSPAGFLAARWKASLALPLLTVATQFYFNTYSADVLHDRSRALIHALKASLAGGTFFLLGVFLFARHSMPREEAIYALGLAALGTVAIRTLSSDVVGFALRRVLILGAGRAGRDLAVILGAHPGYTLCGFLDDRVERRAWNEHGPILGATTAVGEVVERVSADLVVIAEDVQLSPEAERALRGLEFRHVGLMALPRLYEMLAGRIATRHLGERWYTELGYTRPDPLLLAMKRVLDTALGAAMLVAAGPLMVVIAALIKLTSPGPILYSQERVGLHGTPFRMWKFRSMRSDAERGTGPVWASQDDPRVTPIGRMMRRTRIDELPQLWNIIRGEMSLTGPRPERPIFVERFSETISFYEKRLSVRPGLTGWAQVMHRYDESELDVAEKLEYDLYYIKHWSLFLDLQIWIRTIATVLTGNGAR